MKGDKTWVYFFTPKNQTQLSRGIGFLELTKHSSNKIS